MSSPPEARPTESGERVILLDVLRGFALFGVLVSNADWFSGLDLLPPEKAKALAATVSPLLETVTQQAKNLLIYGKSYTLFSFLFGLGFSLQLGRAEARGAEIAPLYARRLAVLLLFGLTHIFLFWYGDILAVYAVLGIFLLLFRKSSDKALLWWAVALILVIQTAGILLERLPQLLLSPEAAAAAAKERMARMAESDAQTLEGFSHGTYFEVLRTNFRLYTQWFLLPRVPTFAGILGRFLLGFLVGRLRLLHEPVKHARFFRRLLAWGFVAAALSQGAVYVFMQPWFRGLLSKGVLRWLPFVMMPVRQVSEVGTAALYIGGFTLLFQRRLGQRVLSVLAPMGRMALTNYLGHTACGLLFFYGYGLGFMGKLNGPQVLLYCVAVYALQIVLSHVWLKSFRFGPLEWIWRSLTYGKAQPMRRQEEAAPKTTASL